MMYDRGQGGLEKDTLAAKLWRRLATEHATGLACYAGGAMRFKGEGGGHVIIEDSEFDYGD